MTVTSPNVPRWIGFLARLVPLTTLPSCIWRLALGFGVPVGFTGELAELYRAPGWITPYVIALSLVSEGLALLTLGLVQPWGEVMPRWIPFLGGRPIPPLAATIPAALGAIAVTMFTLLSLPAWWEEEPGSPQGLAAVVMAACYAPMLAWGPLLAIVTVAYYVRRTRAAELVVPERIVP